MKEPKWEESAPQGSPKSWKKQNHTKSVKIQRTLFGAEFFSSLNKSLTMEWDEFSTPQFYLSLAS